jgi:hypothetical protein
MFMVSRLNNEAGYYERCQGIQEDILARCIGKKKLTNPGPGNSEVTPVTRIKRLDTS